MKIGDKVRIVKGFDTIPNGVRFLDEMKTNVGLSGKIVDAFNNGCFWVRTDKDTWSWPAECLELITDNPIPALTADLEAERDAYALRFAGWLCEWYVPCGDNEWTPNTGPLDPKTTSELLKIYSEL